MEAKSRIFDYTYEKIMDCVALGVFDLLYTGVAIININGHFIYCNQAFLNMYMLPDDVIGRHASEFFLIDKKNLTQEMKEQKMIVSLGKTNNNIYGIHFRYPVFDQDKNFCGVVVESFPGNLSKDNLNNLIESMKSLEMMTYAPGVKKHSSPKTINTFDEIIGKSPPLLNLSYLGQRFASSGEPVLIIGESGTGKELIAKALHNASPRAKQAFISINCAALPEELIESELFGYEEGAFTGAKAKGMQGKFEQANEGTIFLDEIGELPLSVQAKLLRVLESGEIQKLGHKGPLHSNFRLIGATNRDLIQMIRERRFREDLYHRLSVFELTVPPLRERGDDIFLLADYYLNQYHDNPVPISLDDELKRIFREYSWPGNIRELKNVLVYALYAADGHCTTLGVQHLPQRFLNAINPSPAPAQYNSEPILAKTEEKEKEKLKETLLRMRYNKALTARELGISRSTLYRMLNKYEL